ncbi:unnamed protein product, partial [Amoebophrya sp. A120]
GKPLFHPAGKDVGRGKSKHQTGVTNKEFFYTRREDCTSTSDGKGNGNSDLFLCGEKENSTGAVVPAVVTAGKDCAYNVNHPANYSVRTKLQNAISNQSQSKGELQAGDGSE